MNKNLRSNRTPVMLSDFEKIAVDNFAGRLGITRSEGIRRLLEIGLRVEENIGAIGDGAENILDQITVTHSLLDPAAKPALSADQLVAVARTGIGDLVFQFGGLLNDARSLAGQVEALRSNADTLSAARTADQIKIEAQRRASEMRRFLAAIGEREGK